jgi:hypothetical protein
MHDE